MESRLNSFHSICRALKEDEFHLHFQPLVTAEQRHLAGFEALLRWYDPIANRQVPPMEFLPFAEESGVIVLIGEKILQDACRQAKLWNSLSKTTRTVAVNISPHQLADNSFTELVFAALETHKLKPEALKLEISQTALREDDGTLEKLNELRAHGVKLALDDYGRGCSSLNALRLFPFDVIKLERSFLLEMEEDEGARILARGIVSIAHDLGRKVAVVGIETEEQARIAIDTGADLLQGYLFGRPAAANDMQRKASA